MEKQFHPGKAFLFRHLKMDGQQRIGELRRSDPYDRQKQQIDKEIEFQKQAVKNSEQNLCRFELITENRD